MNGATVLVKMLKAYRTEVIFGVPGDTSIPFYEALHDTGTEINHVMARDERSAGFMADAYARISHKPGICECPSGAGPLYAMPGVAEANASSIPLILITSDIPLAGEGKKTITELNTQKLFEPITKWSTVLNDVNRIPEILRRAFRIAVSGRPGAVHLAFPQEVMTQSFTGDEEMIFGETECRTYPAFRTRGSRRVLEEAVRHMGAARRPVIISGGGAKHSQAEAEIQQLAERLQCPVVTTISGQGILSDEHPLAMGVTGDNGYHPHAHRAIREGDLLIYVGCKMGSVSTLKWTLPAPARDLKIIQIDLDPELLGNNYINTISIAGDARLVLRDMITLVAEGFAVAPGPRDDALRVAPLGNLLCAGEKAGLLVGHTEAICTGTLAGYNAVRAAGGEALLVLPENLVIGDAIAHVRREAESDTGVAQKYTFSGSVLFDRMKAQGRYTTSISEIRQRVDKTGLANVFA